VTIEFPSKIMLKKESCSVIQMDSLADSLLAQDLSCDSCVTLTLALCSPIDLEAYWYVFV
jgi:hypothetical protein